jgi:hypothetical protein
LAGRPASIDSWSEQTHEVAERVRQLVVGKDLRLRIAAHRCLRQVAPPALFLEATRELLDDPRPETPRLALRTLSFRQDTAAIPQMIRMLEADPVVARAAADALLQLAPSSRAAVERARHRARPDKRWQLAALLERIDEQRESARSP